MPATLALRVVTPAAKKAIKLGYAKRHLRIDHDDDDHLIRGYIRAATAWAESYLGRTLINTSFLQAIGDQPYANAWPMTPTPLLILPLAYSWPPLQAQAYRLLRSPFVSVDKVSLVDADTGDTSVLTPSQYALDVASEPPRLWLNNTAPLLRRQSLLVQFTAGYGEDHTAVPHDIALALAILVAYFYENRGDMDMSAMPDAAASLLTNHRLVWFGA